MSKDATKERLQNHPLFGELEDEYLDRLVGCSEEITAKSQHYLLFEGEEADTFYLMMDGHADVQINAGNLGMVTISELEAGDVIGWSWMAPPYTWHFSVRTTRQTHLVKFNASCVRALCDEDSAFGLALTRGFLTVVTQRLTETRIQLMEHIT